MNFSLIAYGIDMCSGNCAYCSAAHTLDYNFMWLEKSPDWIEQTIYNLQKTDETNYETYEADYDKLEKLLDNDPQVVKAKAQAQETGVMDVFHVDLWGADPVTNHLVTKDVYDFLSYYTSKNGMRLSVNSSTNGLPLLREDVYEWYKEHNVKLQLSHDGLGQYIRTGKVDPAYDVENIRKGFKEGIITCINTTLNYYNSSLLANRKYWTAFLETVWPQLNKTNVCMSKHDSDHYRRLYIKLNHIYNGNYDVTLQDGTHLGDLQIRNTEEKPHCLDDYIDEWSYIRANMDVLQTLPRWLPFCKYLKSQIERTRFLKTTDSYNGACRAFQRYKHGLKGGVSHTFAMDTKGNYTECNLVDSRSSVLNPGGVHPSYCKGCKYELFEECNQCGSEAFPTECTYLYRWAGFLASGKDKAFDKWRF